MRQSAPWIVGLMMLAAASVFTLAVTSVDADGPAEHSVVGVLGVAVLVTALPGLFIGVGAGALAGRHGVANVCRWVLVVGLAAWSGLCLFVLGVGIGGGGECGYALDPCGAPFSHYLVLMAASATGFVASWALSALIATVDAVDTEA